MEQRPGLSNEIRRVKLRLLPLRLQSHVDRINGTEEERQEEGLWLLYACPSFATPLEMSCEANKEKAAQIRKERKKASRFTACAE